MTEKNFQLSNKIGDAIWLVRGDTYEEFLTHYQEMMDFLTTQLGEELVKATVAQSNGHSNGTGEELSIPVESIEYANTSSKGDRSWKVKGGWAKEWGITMWDDVLEAVGIKDKMQTDKPNIPGEQWIAYYNEWEADGKTRRKVTRLERA